ncbi:hypothetical protein P7C71_g2031, partial [Lecanoromycetidae sp. Uapishka_2]
MAYAFTTHISTERSIAGVQGGQNQRDIEPAVDWPILSTQQLISTESGQPPDTQANGGNGSTDPSPIQRGNIKQRWRQVRSLDEIDNVYDLGFWDNFLDALPELSRS